MNKAKILICAVFAAMAVTACSIEDNPNPEPSVEAQDSTNVDNPFETVTDQPAYAPGL
jgi:PBP1b-binding outer membrane lipoprotein LpoB